LAYSVCVHIVHSELANGIWPNESQEVGVHYTQSLSSSTVSCTLVAKSGEETSCWHLTTSLKVVYDPRN